jgi:hypothetical protein
MLCNSPELGRTAHSSSQILVDILLVKTQLVQHAHQESAPKIRDHQSYRNFFIDSQWWLFTVLTRAVNRVLYIPVLLFCVILPLIGSVSDAKLVEGSLKTTRKR